MSASTRLTPFRASARQMPSPIPLAAPVTNAVLPENSIGCSYPAFCGASLERRKALHHQLVTTFDRGAGVRVREHEQPARLDRAEHELRDVSRIEPGLQRLGVARIALGIGGIGRHD